MLIFEAVKKCVSSLINITPVRLRQSKMSWWGSVTALNPKFYTPFHSDVPQEMTGRVLPTERYDMKMKKEEKELNCDAVHRIFLFLSS